MANVHFNFDAGTFQPYYRKTRRLRRQLLFGLLVLTAALLPVGLAILIAAAKD